MQAIGSAFASVGLVFLTARCEVALSPSLPASSASVRSNHYRKTTLINHSLATPCDRCAVGPFHETRHVYLRKTTVLLMRCEITCSRMVSQVMLTIYYRPISLTCCCCKVMESVIKDHVLSFSLKYKLISRPKYQHGF